jgi:hypothetical protein
MHRLFWKPNSINELCWAFYYVNDNKEVDLTTLQVMRCIFFHNNSILNPKTQVKRRLIMYNTISVINTLKKHVNSNHCNFFLNLKKSIVL